jgi:hypothetical protein
MDTIVSELRRKRALSCKTSPGAVRVYLPGEILYVYRERPAKWIGTFPITKIYGNTVYVRDGQDEKLFQSPPSNHTPVDISNHFISDLHQLFHSTLVNSSSISPNFYSTPTELSADYRVGLTDALTPKDLRRFDPHFFSAKEKDIERLASRG